MDFDWHKTMIRTAQLSALAAINALNRDFSPRLVNKAGNRISLNCDLGYPPRMDNVVRSNQETYFCIGRNHQRLVDTQQVVRSLFFGIVNLFLRGGEIREKGNIVAVLIKVFVLPFPLVPGDQNINLGVISVIHLKQRRCCRYGHTN